MVEVETAKAAVEVPIPFAGVVAAAARRARTSVRVGQPLISVESARPVRRFRRAGGRRFTGRARAARPRSGSGNVLIGYGTATAAAAAGTRSRRRRDRAPAAAVGTAAAAAEVDAGGPPPVISPLVRKLARDHGLDLAAVRGTGPSGLVRRADIEQALADARRRRARTGASATGTDSAPTGERSRGSRCTGLRRAMADKLTRSRREIPEATVWVDVDATELLAARAALNARGTARPVSLLALLARFVVLGPARATPSSTPGSRPTRSSCPSRQPRLRGADRPRAWSCRSSATPTRCRRANCPTALAARPPRPATGALAPADLTGGTITVNNYGVFGVDGSAAIINHPEVAIVGMGRIIDRPWVVDGELAVRKVTQLTLAFDHRACDGGTAGGFLRYVADCVESPVTALGDA